MSANPYNAVLEKTFDMRIPFTAHLELTYRCNLACVHCYADKKSSGRELSLDEIRGVLRQLADMGCLFLALTGGEIFCRPDVFDILDSARGLGFAITIFTNGTLLDRDSVEKIKNVNPMGVEISMYSMSPEIHDRITGLPGSHALTAAAARECRQAGIPTVIKIVLMKYNAGEFPAVRDFALGLGAGCKFDFVLVPSDNGVPLMDRHGISEKRIEELVRELGDPGRPPLPPPPLSSPLCGAGSSVLCVNPEGDVYPCLAIRSVAGNVRERLLPEIWNDSALDIVRNARYRDLIDCSTCRDAGHCGRCSGVALAETGSLFAASKSACSVARAVRGAMRPP